MAATTDEESFTFITEWFDMMSQTNKKFHLTFWPSDNSVSMFDMAKRKLFLKRVKVDSIHLNDLFIGKTVSVYSRQLKIISYADSITKNKFAKQEQIVNIIFNSSNNSNNIACIESLSNLLLYLNNDKNSFYLINKLKSVNIEDVVLKQLSDTLETNFQSNTVIAMQLRGNNIKETIEKWQTQNSNQDGICIVLDNNGIELMNILLNGETSAHKNNCSIVVLKPHIISSGSTGPIINQIIKQGFQISAIESFRLNRESATAFMSVYQGVVKQYRELIEQLITGDVIVCEITSNQNKKQSQLQQQQIQNENQENNNNSNNNNNNNNIVSELREFIGPHDPVLCKHVRPKTIRGQFGIDRIKNAVHCTDLPEDGVLESEFFFQILQQ